MGRLPNERAADLLASSCPHDPSATRLAHACRECLRSALRESQAEAIVQAFSEAARVLRAAADRARDAGRTTTDVLHEVANYLEHLSPEIVLRLQGPDETA
jgi:hypothetical protein